MDDDQHIVEKGTVVNVVKGGFLIQLYNYDRIVLVKLSGKLRKNKIRIVLGDEVTIKLSVYDPGGQGMLVLRH